MLEGLPPNNAAHRLRLVSDERRARAVADLIVESFEPAEAASTVFETDETLPGGAKAWLAEVYFGSAPDEAAVRALIALASDERTARAATFSLTERRDWVANSLAGLKPVRAGRFLIHGSHDRSLVKANDIAVEIEAGLAFGTGHHGTTRGCLLALDALAKRERRTPRDKRALDIGTGSGVLAIAAAKRLHARITASDIDRHAVIAARGNARLNGAARYVRTVHAAGARKRAIAAGAPYDLIFANILLVPLMRLAVPICRLAAPGARIVLSGLLPSQTNAILAIYAAQGLRLERRLALEGWATLVLRR